PDMPQKNRHRYICQISRVRAVAIKAIPRIVDDSTMAVLWVIFETITPEESREINNPAETKKKNDPASPCPIIRSFSMAGINGASRSLETKPTKKMAVMKKSGIIQHLRPDSGTRLWL
ncbi:MAG: hypothetical protein R6X07_12045, partial [Desulfatiglandales bacterium]